MGKEIDKYDVQMSYNIKVMKELWWNSHIQPKDYKQNKNTKRPLGGRNKGLGKIDNTSFYSVIGFKSSTMNKIENLEYVSGVTINKAAEDRCRITGIPEEVIKGTRPIMFNAKTTDKESVGKKEIDEYLENKLYASDGETLGAILNSKDFTELQKLKEEDNIKQYTPLKIKKLEIEFEFAEKKHPKIKKAYEDIFGNSKFTEAMEELKEHDRKLNSVEKFESKLGDYVKSAIENRTYNQDDDMYKILYYFKNNRRFDEVLKDEIKQMLYNMENMKRSDFDEKVENLQYYIEVVDKNLKLAKAVQIIRESEDE